MQNPTPDQGVICPDAIGKRIYPPEKVYDSVNPDGSKVTRGILTKHKHKTMYGTPKDDCGWSGHPVDVVPIVKKDSAMETWEDYKLRRLKDFELFNVRWLNSLSRR